MGLQLSRQNVPGKILLAMAIGSKKAQDYIRRVSHAFGLKAWRIFSSTVLWPTGMPRSTNRAGVWTAWAEPMAEGGWCVTMVDLQRLFCQGRARSPRPRFQPWPRSRPRRSAVDQDGVFKMGFLRCRRCRPSSFESLPSLCFAILPFEFVAPPVFKYLPLLALPS